MLDFFDFILGLFNVHPAAALALPPVRRLPAATFTVAVPRRPAAHAESWARITRGHRGLVPIGPPRSPLAALVAVFTAPPGRLQLAC